MGTTQRRSLKLGDTPEPGPFRRYGWALALMALLLVALCAGIGLREASGQPGSILARLRGESAEGGAAPTFIPPQQDQPAAVSTSTDTANLSTNTPPPTDPPTATATAVQALTVTCKCQGLDYACSNGAVTKNSPRCQPKATPVCGCIGNDWVCSDGTKTKNDIRCGLVCECQGNDLYCNDGTVGQYNPECACWCEGTTMHCNDGGAVPNAPFCGGKKKK